MSTYEQKRKVVKAIQLTGELYDKDGKRLAVKGDWIVIEGDKQYFMTDKDFTDQFQAPGAKAFDELKKLLDLAPKTYPVPMPYPVPQPYPVYPPPRRPRWPGDYWYDGSTITCETTFVSRLE